MRVSTYTDCELLCAIRQNDEEAFAELFRRYWKKVRAMTRARVRSEEVTEEIVQDLFISLWDKRASLSITNLSSYLYAAVKNRVLNYLESQEARKRHWDYYKRFIPTQGLVTENDVELNELMGAIEDGIEHLPEKSKRVFMLSRLEGRSVTEIAHILKLSEKAIEYHLTQSKRKLRLHLKDYILTGYMLFNFLV